MSTTTEKQKERNQAARLRRLAARDARIGEANRVLETFREDTSFYVGSVTGQLCIETRRGWLRVQVRQSFGSLLGDYGKLGFGGTMALAAGQLARWIWDQTRCPLTVWGLWSSERYKLCTVETCGLLRDSTYPDPDKTKCVLCGKQRCGDWWSRDGVVGPCCTGLPNCCSYVPDLEEENEDGMVGGVS
jgi:hypothetical protein